MGAIDTTYTFTATDTITSTKMNNIIDQTTFTNDAVFDTTLAVAGGKLKVRSQGITSTELAANAVTETTISNLNVTTDKIANGSITLLKMAPDSVGIDQIVDASITAPMLDGLQSGTAPIYGARAWVSFNGTVAENLAGTVSRASGSTLATVTLLNHGMSTGNLVNVVGGVASGTYTITKLTNDTFTFVTVASTLLSGVAITLQRQKINGSGNVNSIVDAGTGIYYVNMTIPMPTTNYGASWGGSTSGLSGTNFANTPEIDLKTTSSFQIAFRGTGPAGTANQPVVDLVVFC